MEQITKRSVGKEIYWKILFRSFVITIIIVVSLRAYLFGHGFFEYADQFWNFSLSNNGMIYLSPTVNGVYSPVFKFTRSIITWPYYLFTFFSTNSSIVEKEFIVYSFVLFLSLTYALSDLLYREINKYRQARIGLLGQETLKALFVLIVFSNLAIMNLNVDGGTYSDGIILILLCISFVTILQWDTGYKAALVAGALISVSVLLDPDYYFASVLFLVIAAMVGAYQHKSFRAFLKRFVTPLLLSTPSLLFMILAIQVMTPGSTGLAFRPISDIGFGTANLDFFSAILLIGHSWSTFAIAPPSIYFYHGNLTSLPSYGNIVLLPYSAITLLWLFASFTYFSIALLSLRLRGHVVLTFSFATVMILAIIFALWPGIPVLNTIIVYSTNLPYIGNAIATTFSLPGHFMNIIGITESVLFWIVVVSLFNNFKDSEFLPNLGKSVGRYLPFILIAYTVVVYEICEPVWGLKNFLEILSVALFLFILIVLSRFYFSRVYDKTTKNTNLRTMRSHITNKSNRRYAGVRGKRIISLIIIFMIIFVAIIPGWQAFNGSFYPERQYNVSGIGDVILDVGPYTPVSYPATFVNAYNNITLKEGNYNIISEIYSPSLHKGVQNFSRDPFYFLTNNGYSDSVGPYLKSNNVKYVLLSNPSSEQIETMNASRNISLAGKWNNTYLFTYNGNESATMETAMFLSYSQPNPYYAIAYSIFQSMGISLQVTKAVISDTLGIDTYNMSANLITPKVFLNNNGTNFSNLTSQATPAGLTQEVPLGNSSHQLTNLTGGIYLNLAGSGYVNGEHITQDPGNSSWLTIHSDFLNTSGTLKLLSVIYTPNGNLSGLENNYISYLKPYNHELVLNQSGKRYTPIMTIQGYNVFQVPYQATYSIILQHVSLIKVSYISVVLFLVLMLSVAAAPIRRKRD